MARIRMLFAVLAFGLAVAGLLRLAGWSHARGVAEAEHRQAVAATETQKRLLRLADDLARAERLRLEAEAERDELARSLEDEARADRRARSLSLGLDGVRRLNRR